MRRLGILNTIIVLSVIICFTSISLAGTGGGPGVVPSADDTGIPEVLIDICLGEAINDTLIHGFEGMSDTNMSMTLLSGPGELTYEISNGLIGYYTYTPTADGNFLIEYLVVGPNADSAYFQRKYIVYVDEPPTFADQNKEAKICSPGDVRYVRLDANDPEAQEVRFELISAYGIIDTVTGIIHYYPDTTGTYTFQVAVYDDCHADTAILYDDIVVNTLPVPGFTDTTIYLCEPVEICFEIPFIDEQGDAIIVNQVGGPGYFTILNDSTGEQCFTPTADDNLSYTFYYSIFDDCTPYGLEINPPDPRWLQDSVVVTVIYIQPPVITCPGELTFNTCVTDTFCFDISAVSSIPNSLTYSVISGNAWIDGQTVCFVGEPSSQFDIMIEVEDICENADTCTVPVTIEGSQAPWVNMADDFEVTVCVTETICFDAFVGDPDFDLQDVDVNFGYYDQGTNRVCFEADTAGIYTLILTATDSCSIVADTTNVTINRPTPPTVTLPGDFTSNICGDTKICFDYTTTGSVVNTYIYSPGYIDTLTGDICFYPDTSGVYTIIAEVEGECDGFTDRDTINVTVVFPPTPFIDLGEDFAVNEQCELSEICIDVTTIDIYEILEFNFGTYNDITGQLCFTPDTSGYYVITGQVTDSCGLSAVDTVNIDVTVNNTPITVSVPDSTLYLCYPQEICVDVTLNDPDNDLDSVYVNRGTYADGKVCFTPYDSGNFEIIVTAIDSCGNIAVDTGVVRIETDLGVVLECPGDTTVFTCNLVDTFCFEMPFVPDGVEISVTGINTWYDSASQSICFWSECSNVNHITVTATTPCSEIQCSFDVTIDCNTGPLVILPHDTTIAQCELEEVCIPVGISDPNDNLANVIVTGGDYNPSTGLICFTPDEPGEYNISVVAFDSCGASDSDYVVITVDDNERPFLNIVIYDSTYYQCVPEEICIPIDSLYDPDGNLDTVIFSLGYYNAATNSICFTPDTTGLYCGRVWAIDECGLADSAYICVGVQTGDYVNIECNYPDPDTFNICTPQEICVPLNITGFSFDVTTSYGTWADNELCFFADTGGYYEITVIGTAECNTDTCIVMVEVLIEDQVILTCPDDTSVSLCEPDTICLDFGIVGPYTLLTANGAAYINGETVCVPILSAGQVTTTLIGTGECNADTCSFTITSTFNNPPVITTVAVDPITTCEFTEVCVPITIFDPDGNLESVTSSIGSIEGDSILCFSATSVGTHNIEVIATDSCGATDIDTAVVVVLIGGDATIICPTSITIDTICGPDTICVSAPVSPSGATVTITPKGYYNPATGQVCIPTENSETVNIMMVAEALCGVDTCEFTIQVIKADPVQVNCPSNIDTLLCLLEPQTICYPVSFSGTDAVVSVEPIGTYSNGEICVTIDEPGTYEIDLIVDGYCGTETCRTTIVVEEDQEPVLSLPSFQTFIRCLDVTDSICLDGIYAYDLESEVTLSMTCGAGNLELANNDSGQVCFLPDSFGVYTFCFEVVDDCHTIQGSFDVEVIEEEDCDVCVEVSLQTDSCTVVGVNHEVKLYIDSKEEIAGFDLLLSYDASVMSFNWASIEGTEIDGWEYFTYRLEDADCQGCPSGLLRLIGLADVNNGPFHPPVETLSPVGLFIVIEFYVANDQNLGDQFLPINFIWFDCGDNSFSDPTGYNQMVDIRIFNSEGVLTWDEEDDITYPEESRPFTVGTPDDCIQVIPDKPTPIRCVEFYNGGICVIHPDSIDDRGDINLNGVAYEIADAVVLTNYFIYGFSAFTVSIAGQTAASDVNADGLTLSVADLVYMIRVIVGDAPPIPKTTPYDEKLSIASEYNENQIIVSAEASSDIGAAHLIYDLSDNISIHNVNLTSDAENMDLMWGVYENQLKVLVFSFGTSRIDAGTNGLFEIEVSGDGDLDLNKVEVVDYYGRPYLVASKTAALPTGFALHQNYPNPFNPVTTISFDLPHESKWSLQVYNVNGELVKDISDFSEAGQISIEWDGTTNSGSQVASGVYFYRLNAGSFTESKKMIMLK